MTTIKNLARLVALPIISAGIIGGAAIGMAGTASAATHQAPGFDHSATSQNVSKAPKAIPGWHARHMARVRELNGQNGR
jgi:hypothetical protein